MRPRYLVGLRNELRLVVNHEIAASDGARWCYPQAPHMTDHYGLHAWLGAAVLLQNQYIYIYIYIYNIPYRPLAFPYLIRNLLRIKGFFPLSAPNKPYLILRALRLSSCGKSKLTSGWLSLSVRIGKLITKFQNCADERQ
jgi:hypothetical protein